MRTYTYREVTIPDLTRYVEFMESPVGVRYHGATRDALNAAIASASIVMGREFVELAPKNPRRS